MSDTQVVVFSLNQQYFALNILHIKEIVRSQQTTIIPNSPSYVEGVVNLRGEIIPIISLAKRLQLPEKEPDDLTRVIVVDKEDSRFGLIVDSVEEVGRIDDNSIQPPTNVQTGENYLLGVVKSNEHLWLILDIDKVLAG